MSETINTTFKDTEKNGKVVLYRNYLKDDNSYYCKFTRKTVNSTALIARIQKRNAGTNELALQNAAGFFKQEILDALRGGEAVNLFDLGTLFVTATGNLTSNAMDPENRPTLGVKFTPSSKCQNAVSEIGFDEVTVAHCDAQITSVIDQYTGKNNGTISAGKTVLLIGERIKLDGDQGGVFLCPVDDEGKVIRDEHLWLQSPRVCKSTEKYTEFFLPADAEVGGRYCILLRTYYSRSKLQNLKEPKEAFSSVVEVVA